MQFLTIRVTVSKILVIINSQQLIQRQSPPIIRATGNSERHLQTIPLTVSQILIIINSQQLIQHQFPLKTLLTTLRVRHHLRMGNCFGFGCLLR